MVKLHLFPVATEGAHTSWSMLRNEAAPAPDTAILNWDMLGMGLDTTNEHGTINRFWHQKNYGETTLHLVDWNLQEYHPAFDHGNISWSWKGGKGRVATTITSDWSSYTVKMDQRSVELPTPPSNSLKLQKLPSGKQTVCYWKWP